MSAARELVRSRFTRAKWIWSNNNSAPNEWTLFRKAFTVEHEGDYALLISADTRYHMWINGEPVVLEGGLLRDAYEAGSGFADSVDISPRVKNGENVMDILVWHWGGGGRNNNPLPCGGLIFECDGLGVYSDRGTLSSRQRSYAASSEGDQPAYLYGGFNIVYDANCVDPPLEPSVELDPVPFGNLYPRPIPLFRFSGVVESDYTVKGDVYEVKLPEPRHILPYFRLEAKGGERIGVRTDRYTVPGGPGDHNNRYNGHRTEYICKPGLNEFISLDWQACASILFSVPDAVRVIALGYRVSEYDTGCPGLLRTGNPDVDTLIEKCARTLTFCMRDNFMDCPDRERGQWIGDVSVQTPQVFLALDRNAVPLLKKAILNFLRLRKGDVLVGNVPGIHSCELPSQSLNALSDIGMIRTYYDFTADREILEEAFEPAIRYLSLWEMDGGGLVASRKGDWRWADHLCNNDVLLQENCWYVMALRFCKYMADTLGRHGHDAFIQERLESIERAFRTYWRQANGFQGFSSAEGYFDERANALAALAGLASPDQYAHIKNLLVSVYNCAPYLEGYVLEALCRMGYKREAFDRMMERYMPLIRNGDGTLWEDFHILGTRNHAWSGAPLTILYKHFAGAYTYDAWRTVDIQPDYSVLKRYDFTIDMGRGILRVHAEEGDPQMKVTR
ncbi:MAG: hypothetical protein LBS11_00965 [Oscillospiraceae bacterium]|jgi:hypothetical protein|nr:hypothetical protein [Oscillospiraceae bacterium]